MKIVDSSGWIEYLRGTELGDLYAQHMEDGDVLVPAVVLYEVYKFVRRELGEGAATRAVARVQRYPIVDLDEMLAVLAADLSLRHGLAMADAMIYATALALEAEIVTGDADLKDLPGVTFLAK